MDPLIHPLPPNEQTKLPAMPVDILAKSIQVGDIIFIRVSALPFIAVANATGTWTNHVGVVTHRDNDALHVGESSFPFSRTTPFSKFVARSMNGRVAIARLKTALTLEQLEHIKHAARRRHGILYDTGFDLFSNRQFCSRYVHEIIKEATGIEVGEVETLREVVDRQPEMNLAFWKLWYLGKIPWDRQTVTPASLLRSHQLMPVFFGNAVFDNKDLPSMVRSIKAMYSSALFWRKTK